jgi:hypothetical protein
MQEGPEFDQAMAASSRAWESLFPEAVARIQARKAEEQAALRREVIDEVIDRIENFYGTRDGILALLNQMKEET